MKNEIVRTFMATTKIAETKNKTVEKIMDFLTAPDSVKRMIDATEMGLPAVTGVVKQLEKKFANSDFPLHKNGEHANSANRRNIGWMIKYIMKEYGYVPASTGDVQSRIGTFAGSEYFTTGAKYKKSGKANYTIEVTSVSAGK